MFGRLSWLGSPRLSLLARGKMMTKRREKKSESLEIRLPYSQKQAFMEACRERGMTASDVLREFIAAELQPEPETPRSWAMTLRNNPLKTAAGGISAALAAATFGTGVSFAEESTFDRFDANKDGLVSYGEFLDSLGGSGDDQMIRRVEKTVAVDMPQGGPGGMPPMPPQPADGHGDLFRSLDRDGSQTLSRDEFDGAGSYSKRTDQTIERDGVKTRVVGLEVYHYDLTEEGVSQVSIEALSKSVPVDASPAEVEAALEELRADIEKKRQERPVPPVPPTPRN